MGDKSKIEWTDATWNPVTGCTKVSTGCDHCYAETIAHRFAGTKAYPQGFAVTLRPERLDQPLRWKRPRLVFVNSMSDLFHRDVPDEFIARVWAVMALAPRHTFQVLTKRHGRMRALLRDRRFEVLVGQATADVIGDDERREERMLQGAWTWDVSHRSYHAPDWPLPNVWVGVSVEDQQSANLRIPALIETPAAVRWVSCEPLVGPVDITGDLCTKGGSDFVDWVVVGGESGTGARPMHPAWARSLRDQCQRAGVPFLFKQWGEWVATGIPSCSAAWVFPDGAVEPYEPGDLSADMLMRRVGKKVAGRVLDGRTWDEYPS